MINWTRIAEAIEFYKQHGFEYIEVPWTVQPSTAMITLDDPDYLDLITSNNECLVGSAEQGFLQLAREDRLPHVNYVACTPCFRVRDAQKNTPRTHQPYFMKVELFSRCDNEHQALLASKEILNRAWKFMERKPESIETDDGFDLVLNGVEVGSYGFKQYPGIGYWAYGTGLAEPRYSYVKGTQTC